MKNYRVYLTCTAVHYADVEANSKEEAEERALDMAGRSSELRLSSENDWEVMQSEEVA
jgi:hypothetical protein